MTTDTRTIDQLTNSEVCNLIADRLHIGNGQVTIEIVYLNGHFVRTHIHSGPLGADAIDQLKGTTP